MLRWWRQWGSGSDSGRIAGPIASLPAVSAPHAAGLALAITLVATAWNEGTSLYRLVGPNALSKGTAPTHNPEQRFSAEPISAAHLFGISAARAPNDSDLDAPETRTLVLTGTLASTDPEKGYAIIGATREQTHYYAVGDSMAEGCRLHSVYADHVVIERAGQLETLTLPRQTGPGLFVASIASRRGGASSEISGSAPVPGAAASPEEQDVRSALDLESSRMAAVLTEKPYYSGDQFRGVVVEPGSDPGLLERLGLKPGDLLHHVDGTMIVDQSRIQILREHLATGKPVQVSVTRPGEGAVDLTLDSSLVAGLLQ